MGLKYEISYMWKNRRFNLWDGTSYMWHKRQKLYAVIYLVGAAALTYFGMYVEAFLALILVEMRVSRKEQRYG
jgi:hypothetical protein